MLTGKVVLVTGGGSGIGRATAVRFAQDGAKVVVADIGVAGGRETVRRIKQARGAGVFIKADMIKARDVAALVEKTVATFGRLDCVFNNAGVAGVNSSLVDCTEENWDRIMAVNLKGVWLCLKYAIAQMLKQGGGAIVNTASVAGLIGAPGLGAYSASKGGVVQLTRTAALEYAKSGIRVNAVCPAFIQTPMVDRLVNGNVEVEARLNRAQPIGRMGTPEEVAEAVVWLCSDAASFVTGHLLTVDGGMVAQ